MEEKIKVYVDSNEKIFITDCYLADNTKIICEFYHEESEIEYSNCKLLNLQEYDKQKDQRIAELEQELAELKEKAIVPKFNVGQEVWHFITGKPIKDIIVRNDLFQYELSALKFGMYEDYLFATEQEAQAKLQELQNGDFSGE